MIIDWPKVPDEVIETARSLCVHSDHTQWLLGDLLVDVIDELRDIFARVVERPPSRARAEIIRQIATGTGLDPSTLRDRECMSRFYPEQVRSHYTHVLTYHQMRACKAAGPLWGEYAKKAIEWADAHRGRTASVAEIRYWIAKEKNGQPEWVGRWERLFALATVIMEDERADRHVRRALTEFVAYCHVHGVPVPAGY